MTDRLINSAWWAALMGMICVMGTAALFIGYRTLFDVLEHRYDQALTDLATGAFCSAGTWLLCKYRNDLLL